MEPVTRRDSPPPLQVDVHVAVAAVWLVSAAGLVTVMGKGLACWLTTNVSGSSSTVNGTVVSFLARTL